MKMTRTNFNSKYMAHQHIFDAQGKQLCCNQEEKIYTKAQAQELIGHQKVDGHDHDEHGDDDGHDHSQGNPDSNFKLFLPAIISFVLLIVAIVFDNYWKPGFFTDWLRVAWYVAAYLPVGFPVLKEAFQTIAKG